MFMIEDLSPYKSAWLNPLLARGYSGAQETDGTEREVVNGRTTALRSVFGSDVCVGSQDHRGSVVAKVSVLRKRSERPWDSLTELWYIKLERHMGGRVVDSGMTNYHDPRVPARSLAIRRASNDHFSRDQL